MWLLCCFRYRIASAGCGGECWLCHNCCAWQHGLCNSLRECSVFPLFSCSEFTNQWQLLLGVAAIHWLPFPSWLQSAPLGLFAAFPRRPIIQTATQDIIFTEIYAELFRRDRFAIFQSEQTTPNTHGSVANSSETSRKCTTNVKINAFWSLANNAPTDWKSNVSGHIP